MAQDCESINYPKKKKRKLNHDVTTRTSNVEANNTSNTNTNERASMEESKEESRRDTSHHQTTSDVAFYLNKTHLIANGSKHEFNKYALALNEIITTSCASSIIEKCIIFSFKVDPEWIFNLCPILTNKQKTEQIYILHGESLDEHYALCNYQSMYNHLRIFKVKMQFSYGTHHTKMIILLYKNEGIRVVVTSANFIERDWIHKCNGIYLQDFPFKTDTNVNTSEFGDTLHSYCNKLNGLSNKAIMDFGFLKRYDFTSAKVLLVPSVPGYHKKDELCLFGHKRLQHTLTKHKVTTNQNHLILNCSSIGSLTEKWFVDEFYRGSFYGDSDRNLKLIWPTANDVRNSIEGYVAGGSLCLSHKCCKAFLFKYFSKWNGEISGRQRLMPHIKSYSVVDAKEKTLNAFLMTSANLSTAAWGAMQKNNTQLFIRSFELGCLYLPQHYLDHYVKHKHRGFNLTDLPLKKRNVQITNAAMEHADIDEIEFEILYQANKVNRVSSNNKKRIQIIFPIPMEVMDVERYTKEDQPWVWDVKHSESDLFGLRWPPSQM